MVLRDQDLNLANFLCGRLLAVLKLGDEVVAGRCLWQSLVLWGLGLRCRLDQRFDKLGLLENHESPLRIASRVRLLFHTKIIAQL